MLNLPEPYWIEHGKSHGFSYFQSSYRFLQHFCMMYPDIIKNQWMLGRTFDEVSPSHTNLHYVKSFSDIPDDCDGPEEIFLFNTKPHLNSHHLNQELHFDGFRMNEVEPEKIIKSWQLLEKINPDVYLRFLYNEFIAFKNDSVAAKFLASSFVANIPQFHLQELKTHLVNWLNVPLSDENCGWESCDKKRIRYGANCPRHHWEMLYAYVFPEEYL